MALLEDVWADDAVAQKAILRNRRVHPKCRPLVVQKKMAGHPTPVVGITIDNARQTMASHQPLTRTQWISAENAGIHCTNTVMR